MVKVICAILFNSNGEILITRRFKGPHKGKWEFPGGKVEGIESNHDCLHRELSEELDVKVRYFINLLSSNINTPVTV